MDRPTPFSAPMVRAILADQKTQTRRVVKGAPDDWAPIGPEVFSPTMVDRHGDEQPGPNAFGAGNEDGSDWIRCSYGQPGDRLWVREAWRTSPMFDDKPPRELPHWAPLRYEADKALRGAWAGYGYAKSAKYRPPMFMPRWASRITLEVVGVRVERLQDISEADAMAEGIVPCFEGYGLPDGSHFHAVDPRQSYWSLWEDINGARSVEANPWVWAVEFQRIGGAA